MEQISLSTSQAEAALRRLVDEADRASLSMGPSGLSGVTSTLSGDLMALGGPSGALQMTARAFGVSGEAASAFARVLGTTVGPFAAVGAAAAAMVSVSAQLVVSAAESSRELERLGRISADEGRALRTAAGSVEGFTQALSELGDTIVAKLASQVTRRVDDFFSGTTLAAQVLTDLIATRGVRSWQEYAESVGIATGKIIDLKSAMAATSDRAVTSIVDFLKKDAEKAEKAAEAYRKASEEFRRTAEANRAVMTTTQITGNVGAVEAFTANLPSAGVGRANAAAQLTASALATVEQPAAMTESTRRRMMEQNAADAAAYSAVWVQTASIVGQALSTLGASFGASTVAQKAFAATSIAISTAIATMQALAAPPGPPATIPLAVATGVFGAVQLAAALAGKIAPGGFSGASTGGMGGWGETREEMRAFRREERIERRTERREARQERREQRRSAREGGGTTIFALDTRELVRQLREMGALGYATGGG